MGADLERIAAQHGFNVFAFTRQQLDITEIDGVRSTLKNIKPDVVVNAAAYTAVDKAESEKELAFAVNRDGARNLAYVCNELNIPLVHISTDYVFDGNKTSDYYEDDLASPLNVYGQSKWQGEEAVRRVCKRYIILRVSWVFGVFGNNFVKTICGLARAREELKIVEDQQGSPTSTRSISQAIMKICQKLEGNWGTFHYACRPATNWFEFAQAIVSELSQLEAITVKKVLPIKTDGYSFVAKRPMNSILNCEKIEKVFGITQLNWRDELHDVLVELKNTSWKG